MKTDPEVSVIIPAYNREDFIADSINSVLAQTFSDYEIIIINDGSTDRTADIVKSIKNPRIKLLSTQRQGPYIARNYGIKRARGNYLAFLDSDDIWFASKLEKQMRTITATPDTALVFTNGYVFETDSRRYSLKLTHYSDQSRKLDKGYTELLKKNYISTSSVLIKKDVFEKLGYFLKENRGCLDYQMWLRVARGYKIEYIHEPLLLYTAHEQSLSSKKVDRLKDILYLYGLEEDEIKRTGSRENLATLHDSKARTLKELGVRLYFADDRKNARKYFIRAINEGNQSFNEALKFLFWLFVPYSLHSYLKSRSIISKLENKVYDIGPS